MPRLQWSRLLALMLLILPLSLMAATPEKSWPDIISLPNGFQPEGIAIGRNQTAYFGSIPTGAIYQANLRTGQGSILVPGQAGRNALGMTYDARTDYLYVAGGFAGQAHVYDASSGALVADYQLTAAPDTLVNDVALTPDAVYFTDSFNPWFYRLPLHANGQLPPAAAVQTIPLSGDFQFLPGGLNSNGIVATPDGSTLIIDHTDLGDLYRVDPSSGVAALITTVPLYPDGLVLHGNQLYVVNFFDHLQVLQLNHDLTAATEVGIITDPMFESTATAAILGNSIYVVNARFDAPVTPDTPYWVTRVDRRP